MSFPAIIIALSIIAALLSALFRNQRVTAAIIAALGAASLAGVILFVPLNQAFNILGLSIRLESAWVIFGRSLDLEPTIRPMVGFLYLAGLYLFTGSWVTVKNRFFPSIALLMLATVASSLMVEPFLFASAFIGLAAMGSVLLLVSTEHYGNIGAVRLMVLYTFAVLSILLSGWMIETGSGTTVSSAGGIGAALVLSIGFAILMAIPPFHVWLTSSVQESNTYVLSFVTIILQAAGFFFLLRSLDAYTWLREDPVLGSSLGVISTGTILLASLWALSAKDIRKVFAYAIVSDMGVILLALSSLNSEGARVALSLFGTRVFSIAVSALGLSVISKAGNGLNGIGRRHPRAALALLLGLFSLGGFPLTPGFPGRWALLSLGTERSFFPHTVLLVSMILFAFTALRWAARLFEPLHDSSIGSEDQPIGQRVYLIIGIASLFLLGIAPQLLIPWVVEVAAGLTHLIP